MAIVPLYDRLLVKRTEAPTTTASGLVIPGSCQGKSLEGVVLAVGEGRILQDGNLVELVVRAGDNILFGKHSGIEVTVGGEEFLLLREEEVLAVITDDDLTEEELASDPE